MEILQNLKADALLNTMACLLAAFIFGSAIGLERQYRQRNAGLRTNVLVSVGSAVFVDLANRLGGHEAAVHVIAYVVSGVGFLGAGTIMKEGGFCRVKQNLPNATTIGSVGSRKKSYMSYGRSVQKN
jgi:putative Mg2+ transporter-C (MgtC) family protein